MKLLVDHGFASGCDVIFIWNSEGITRTGQSNHLAFKMYLDGAENCVPRLHLVLQFKQLTLWGF